MTTDQRDTPVEQPGEPIQSPGTTLRMERENQGLTTAATAATLRLPEKILLHLEASRFDQLHGDTFARGYVRSYARMLGLDPSRLALDYDRYMGIEVRERNVSAIDKLTPPGKGGTLLITLTTVGVAVALLALLVLWWYDNRPEPLNGDTSTIAEQMIDEVQVDALDLPVMLARSESDNSETMLLGEAAELEVASEPESLPEQSASDQAAAVAPSPEPPVTDEQPAGGLQMRFNANCWLQVTAVGGRVLHSALMQPDQSLSIDHSGPVDLVIGAVEAVESIRFNGQPVDLQSSSQSGVVRLRLGQ